MPCPQSGTHFKPTKGEKIMCVTFYVSVTHLSGFVDCIHLTRNTCSAEPREARGGGGSISGRRTGEK